MGTFFTGFPEFPYDPTNKKELEFSRLQKTQRWDPSSPQFREQYKAFRLALAKETGAAVDTFFLTRYPTFNYRSGASPWVEFSRLVKSQGIVESGEYRRIRRVFENVFQGAFNRNVDQFFRKYPGFNYNPRDESKAQFERLREHKRWFFPQKEWPRPKEEPEYKKARAEFFSAFIDDFTYFFGVGEDIRDWEYLCDILQVQPVPQSVEACKAVLESYYINIFNLYDHVQWGTPLVYHSSQQELTNYSCRFKLIFPQQLAESTCMKVLLRRFDDLDGVPRHDSSGWSGVITIDKRRRMRRAPET